MNEKFPIRKSIITRKDIVFLMDEIDKLILINLGKNARISSHDIAIKLQEFGHTITDRAVRQRLGRLEKNNVVFGYSAILNPNLVSEKINRTVLLKFKYGKNSQEKITQLMEYLNESSFCIYATRLSGDYDCICNFIFDSIEQHELETNNFLNRFSSLIADYRTYESKMIKLSPYAVFDEHGIKEKKIRVYQILESIKKYDTLNDRLQAIVESLVKYFDAAFARVWFVDMQRKNLILKFSAGMYTRIDGEFSKVSINSLKIGPCVLKNTPVVTNDVVNDPRIRHQEWAKKEKFKSFAAYPLIYKGKAIAVIAMFSRKKLNHVDFEVLGIFSEQLSKELAGFFEAKNFLSE